MNNLGLIIKDSKVVVSSRDVATVYGKGHDNVLKKIDSFLEVVPELADVNFNVSEYKDTSGKGNKEYLMDRQGFSILVNKFTGAEALKFTVEYTKAFENMAIQLQVDKPKDSYMIENPIERAKRWIEEQEDKLLLEQRIAEYEPKITYLDNILNSNNAITVTQIAADYGLSATRLNRILEGNEVQYKVNKQWILKAKYKDKGYTKSETFIDDTGKPRLNTKWTQKGRLFIHQILESLGIKALIDRTN